MIQRKMQERIRENLHSVHPSFHSAGRSSAMFTAHTANYGPSQAIHADYAVYRIPYMDSIELRVRIGEHELMTRRSHIEYYAEQLKRELIHKYMKELKNYVKYGQSSHIYTP